MLLSASTPHHLPLSRLLLQPPGRCQRPLSALTARSLPFNPAAAWRSSCLTSPHERALCLRMARRKGGNRRAPAGSWWASFFEAIETTTMDDKMLLKEVLNNTG